MKHQKLYAALTIIITLVITVFFLQEMKQNARMETNLDEYMPKEHPAFVYSDKAEDWFNIKDGILIAIENKNGIYNSQTLQKIKDITMDLQDMEEFDDNDVTSLYSADNITGSEYGMEVETFYKKVPKSDEKINSIRENVRTNDMVYERLVSEDETVALIVAGMNDSTFTEAFYDEILEFAGSFESDKNTIYVAGRPIVEGTMALLGPADMKRMVPIVLLIIALVLFFSLRSVRGTVITLAVVFVSTIWAFGLMAALGVPIYSVSTMMPVMLIAIGVADGIHLLVHYKHYAIKNPDESRKNKIKEMLVNMWKPIVMTSITTSIGFVSLLTSQVYPIKYFGLFTAFGIMVAMLMSLILLPAGIYLFGVRIPKTNKSPKNDAVDKFLKKATDYVLKYKKSIIWLSIAIAVISIFGIQRVWINSSFLDKFEKDSDIVLTDNFINSKFGGTSTLNVILESKDADAFKQPENLRLIDQMQHKTEKLAKVGNSFSLSDYIKRMNKVMNADSNSYYTIPDNSNLVAQYLLLYEMSGDPENLTKVVNYDYNKTNITFQLKGDDSKTIDEALRVIKTFDDKLSENGIQINFAGSGYKALVFTDLILEGQIKSLVISLLLVIILLTLMFRSVKAGVVGSVPIIITALISFGVMGLLNIPLSTTTALLSSIAIGIGIDYAIHFIEHYRVNLKKNAGALQAMYVTMQQTGKAILFNAVVVIAGFLVLLFSVFPPNRTLGALVSLNMFTSLVGTLTIMMILFYRMKIFVKKKNKKNQK
ncbi:MAG: MMPL family transporter [Prolixibacteraceae bacterium]|nr:MMPL family transporter [Prolixibacteraceae bacterium]